MCAELPPGAFRVSGGFHSRGWSQRVLLPQSPDLTCGCVILQRLWWQRSLTIYGEMTFFSHIVKQSSSLVFPACVTEPWTESRICSCPYVCVFESSCVHIRALLVTQWLCFLTGCDKPGVPGEKGLPCTSIRNHSSGEGTFWDCFFSNVEMLNNNVEIFILCKISASGHTHGWEQRANYTK